MTGWKIDAVVVFSRHFKQLNTEWYPAVWIHNQILVSQRTYYYLSAPRPLLSQTPPRGKVSPLTSTCYRRCEVSTCPILPPSKTYTWSDNSGKPDHQRLSWHPEVDRPAHIYTHFPLLLIEEVRDTVYIKVQILHLDQFETPRRNTQFEYPKIKGQLMLKQDGIHI